MLKRLALYPFFFALYIILAPLAENLRQVDPTQALRPLAVLLMIVTAGLLLFYALFKDWHYAAYLIFLLCVFFFLFGHLYRLTQEKLSIGNKAVVVPLFLGLWGGLLGVLSLKSVWSRLGGKRWMLPFFNLVMAVALVRPGYLVVSGTLFAPHQANAAPASNLPDTGGATLDCSTRPDIYYIVLDAYGRDDVLDTLYNLDNRPFLDYLKRKGFYVAGDSHSNYMQTVFSIPSSLNFSYIDPPQEGVNGLVYFSNLVKDNQIMSTLKRCGYRTVAFESGFYFTERPDVDVYLTSDNNLNDFESLLLADSPVDVLLERLHYQAPKYSYAAHRQQVLYSFEKLAKLYKMPGPKIVFAHIVSPHPPFVFDANGRAVEPSRGFSFNDGDDFQGTLEEYRAGYAQQVKFVNHKMEQVIDAILTKSSTPPVIIIQGDHGPGSRLNWSSPAQSCLWERTSILNAYYLPGGEESRLYPSISPVNSFRVVLDAYFGANLQLLPDSSYFTSQRLEGQAIDITTERTSQQNCAIPTR